MQLLTFHLKLFVFANNSKHTFRPSEFHIKIRCESIFISRKKKKTRRRKNQFFLGSCMCIFMATSRIANVKSEKSGRKHNKNKYNSKEGAASLRFRFYGWQLTLKASRKLYHLHSSDASAVCLWATQIIQAQSKIFALKIENANRRATGKQKQKLLGRNSFKKANKRI